MVVLHPRVAELVARLYRLAEVSPKDIEAIAVIVDDALRRNDPHWTHHDPLDPLSPPTDGDG
jgi:hypothetical protein